MDYNPTFERSFNGKFNSDNNFISIKGGSEGFLLEDELNELQWIQNEQRAQGIRSLINSGLMLTQFNILEDASDEDASVYIYNDINGNMPVSKLLFNIKDFIPVNMNGYIFRLAGNYKKNAYGQDTTNNNILLDLPPYPTTNDRDSILILEAWFQEIKLEDNIKYLGGASNNIISTFEMDNRINLETTHRVQLRWNFRFVTDMNQMNDTIYALGDTTLNQYKLASTYTDDICAKDDTLYISKNNLNSLAADGKFYAIPILHIRQEKGKSIINFDQIENLCSLSQISLFYKTSKNGININDNNNPIYISYKNNSVNFVDQYGNYVDEIVKNITLDNNMSDSEFITGTAKFNSTSGVTVPCNVENTNYKVMILPHYYTSDDMNNIGEYWIDNKYTNKFIVKNTGKNISSYFDWVLLKDSSNYISGTNAFNGSVGVTVNHNNKSSDYIVFITPSSVTYGDIGEYWVESKTDNSFVVKNTGVNRTTFFDWVLINKSALYTHGTGTFNSTIGTAISHDCNSVDYNIMIMPTGSSNGDIGAYYIDNKIPNSFTVKNTGYNHTNTFDWIIFKSNNSKIKLVNDGTKLEILKGDNSFSDVGLNNLIINGNTLRFNNNISVTGTPCDNVNLTVNRGTLQNANIRWDENEQCWKAGLFDSEQRILLKGSTLINDLDINFHYDSNNPVNTGKRLNFDGDFYAHKLTVVNSNDYAEYFYKDEDELSPGDVIMANPNGEGYVKSNKSYSKLVVGVYSDTYGYIVGNNDEDNYMPIGLCGRVKVKVTGKVNKGDLLVSSNIPGVAMKSNRYCAGTVIGKALESKDNDDIKRINMLIMSI